MNVVKITNKIAFVTVALLMYWVFIFISSTVFGFKTFGENMTELFLLSILGIFSILAGSIILNVMYNLTAIAEGRGREVEKSSIKSWPLSVFLGSLVLVFLALYAGDLATTKRGERLLVSSAIDLLDEQKDIINRLSNYTFSREYIENSSTDIKLLSKVEEKFPNITVIVEDVIDDKPFLLGFTSYSGLGDNEEALKADYILSTSSEERSYIRSVFEDDVADHRFASNNDQYEVYFPVSTDNGTIVLHLSQRSRYGKFGS